MNKNRYKDSRDVVASQGNLSILPRPFSGRKKPNPQTAPKKKNDFA